MEVIVKEEVRKVSGAMSTGLIRASVCPLAGNGLDEAFGFPVGLRAIRLGKEVFDSKFAAGGSEVVRAIGSATIGEHALHGDPMSFVELDCLMKRRNNTSDLFIWEQAGKSQARVIINGDVEIFDSGAAIAQSAITSSAHAGALKTAQFLDVEVNEFAGPSTLVALWRSLGRLQSRETMKSVTAQNARDGSFGGIEHGEDLRVGATLSAQGQNVSFEPRSGSTRLALGNRGAVLELGWKARFTRSL